MYPKKALVLLLILSLSALLHRTTGRQLSAQQGGSQQDGQQGAGQSCNQQGAGQPCNQQGGGNQQGVGQPCGQQGAGQPCNQQGGGNQQGGSGNQQGGSGNQQGVGQQGPQQTAGAQPVGVCYGTMANNQPSAQEAISVLRSNGINRIRLYGPDHNALNSLRNTGIEVVLGVPNEQLQNVASSQENANQWIRNNVQSYQDVHFRYIVVGNGITPVHDQTSQFAQFVLPAMQNIRNALQAAGQQRSNIPVTTAIDQSETLGQFYPPSQGQFAPEVQQFLRPIINFLVNNNNVPLLINFHPYFSYAFNKAEIPQELTQKGTGQQDPRLEYAILRSQNVMVQDGQFGYTNVFDAMVDSVHSALEKCGGSSLDVVVSETGWPTAGGPGASNENAATHNNNVINHARNNGTPKRPNKRIETYLYSLFDENQKDNQEVQRHWGIFWNNKQAKYQINFQGQQQQ